MKKYNIIMILFIISIIILSILLSCELFTPPVEVDDNDNNDYDGTEINGLINNDDFLINTSGSTYPNYWEASWWDPPYQYLNNYDGRNGVVSFYRNSGSGGLDMEQTLSLSFIINNSSKFEICFKIVSASLDGDGNSGTEAPITFQLYFKKDGDVDLGVVRYYNYTHDGDSASNPDFELVTQNIWITKIYTLSDIGIPKNYYLDRIRIGGNGWTLESYVDYVRIY